MHRQRADHHWCNSNHCTMRSRISGHSFASGQDMRPGGGRVRVAGKPLEARATAIRDVHDHRNECLGRIPQRSRLTVTLVEAANASSGSGNDFWTKPEIVQAICGKS